VTVLISCHVEGCVRYDRRGEQCDDGHRFDGLWMRARLHAASCENGIIDPGEQCDDGNLTDGDGCDHNCGIPGCPTVMSTQASSATTGRDRQRWVRA